MILAVFIGTFIYYILYLGDAYIEVSFLINL